MSDTQDDLARQQHIVSVPCCLGFMTLLRLKAYLSVNS